jgi:hypothetical protein
MTEVCDAHICIWDLLEVGYRGDAPITYNNRSCLRVPRYGSEHPSPTTFAPFCGRARVVGRALEQGATSLVCGILFRIPGRPAMGNPMAGFRAVATGPLDNEPKCFGSSTNIIYMAGAPPYINYVIISVIMIP